MASSSSENMARIDTWSFNPGFADSWLSDAFSRDTEALTRALQHSISNTIPLPTTTTTFTSSNISGSDPETTLKRHRTADNNPVPPTGKVSKPKRKSRTSKRSQTTFIQADPANFRQMVQQVTGVSFVNAQMFPAPIMKPKPQRHGCLPTLDTSAFLLDQHLHHPSSVVADAVASVGGDSLDCDNLPSFPTLESWKA